MMPHSNILIFRSVKQNNIFHLVVIEKQWVAIFVAYMGICMACSGVFAAFCMAFYVVLFLPLTGNGPVGWTIVLTRLKPATYTDQ